MDYGKFSSTVGQEEGIKIKIKFPKYTIGEKKYFYSILFPAIELQTKINASIQIFTSVFVYTSLHFTILDYCSSGDF